VPGAAEDANSDAAHRRSHDSEAHCIVRLLHQLQARPQYSTEDALHELLAAGQTGCERVSSKRCCLSKGKHTGANIQSRGRAGGLFAARNTLSGSGGWVGIAVRRSSSRLSWCLARLACIVMFQE